MPPLKRETPGPGQESVWDYPRPPRIEKTTMPIKVVFDGQVIAETTNAYRILETSHPPAYYIPPADINMDALQPVARRTFCEFKGGASYYDVMLNGKKATAAAWAYKDPNPAYAAAKDHICFYASKMDACYVDGEQVQAQEGDFYGGWITSHVVGPFKGAPGTMGW